MFMRVGCSITFRAPRAVLTLLLGANMDSSDKIKPLAIGKADVSEVYNLWYNVDRMASEV